MRKEGNHTHLSCKIQSGRCKHHNSLLLRFELSKQKGLLTKFCVVVESYVTQSFKTKLARRGVNSADSYNCHLSYIYFQQHCANANICFLFRLVLTTNHQLWYPEVT